jgi:prepilin-type N-terminal cleavage/methylation domain-containing protein
MRKRAGFTLVELLIYIGIFAILAVAFSSILVTFSRVTITQSSKNEVSSQLSFVTQKIQRMISNASHVVATNSIEDTDLGKAWDEVDNNLGVAQKYLVLKLQEDENSSNSETTPTIIYLDGGVIKVRKGRGGEIGHSTTSELTTDKVVVDKLEFTKFVDYPGRDLIEIDLALSYNSEQEQEQVSRKLILGTSKAYAAIFDTTLLPGANNNVDVGSSGYKWKDAFFSGTLKVDTEAQVKTLKVSDNGTPMSGIYNGQITVDPPNIGADSNGTVSVNPPSGITIESGDRVFLTPNKSLKSGLLMVGAFANSSTNKIDITLRNTKSSAVNGEVRSWYYLLIK